jgi:hypothetical protein
MWVSQHGVIYCDSDAGDRVMVVDVASDSAYIMYWIRSYYGQIDGHTYHISYTGRTHGQICSEMASAAGDIAQAANGNMEIEGVPGEPLV